MIENVSKVFFENMTFLNKTLEKTVLTTKDILDICGSFDTNALVAASMGLVMSLLFLFYVRRWRSKLKPVHKVFIDKFGLTLIALLFAAIIVRLLRAA